MKYPAVALAFSLCLASTLAATPQGVAPQSPAPGFRLFGPHGTTDTYMVDTAGTIVHTWPGSYPPGNGMYLEADGTLVRSGQFPGAPSIGGRGGAVQRIAFDGTVLWDYQLATANEWAHHDIEPMPNGNVLFIAWDLMTAADAIAAGRDPALLNSPNWLPDSIFEVQQTGPTTGTVVWEWHVMDHLIQDFDPTKANFGNVANNPQLVDINFPQNVLNNGEWNHSNSIDYDPVRDIILLNAVFQEEFWLIDHSTTTAEAAGHTGGAFGQGGDILYRWGNPQSYRAGTAANQKLYFPHGSHIIPQGLPGAGNVLVFNNRAGLAVGQNYSTVVELQLPATFNLTPGTAYGPADFVWEYLAPTPTNLYSPGLSNAERLPNGNTLVCSGRQNGWLFELTPGKQKVWEYFNQLPSPTSLVFQVSYYERSLWADKVTMPAASGGTVSFDMVAGSTQGDNLYLLLGTASGTSPGLTYGGFTIPLNVDPYLRFTAHTAGNPPLATFFGSLDPLGNGSASLTLPPIPGLGGLTLHHAFAVIDPSTAAITMASNAVPLDIQ